MADKKTTAKPRVKRAKWGTAGNPVAVADLAGTIATDGEHLYVLDEVRRGEYLLRMYQKGGGK